MATPRKRRRAVRISDAPDYDRTADRPEFVSAFGPEESQGGQDSSRNVELDEFSAEEPTGEAFYREQMPPHYGEN
ncbi:hypothetical protein [Corynebacterium sp.]|uniref:hypothetical protein n=1 Tax=Corynebacterium sp. TaxID=1720 RepID=UPI0026DA75AE|nr:hypothetical protein [Corynebacterium sp.]MDO5033040.1 hypothetical protein [Corynebacterium sp.]